MADDAPREQAMIADVLQNLREQLHSEPSVEDEAHAADVEILVNAAIAELQRVTIGRPLPGSGGPVLGSGIIHELVRKARDPHPLEAADATEHAVDTTR